jgi:phosphatidate cytidylyltransferase
MYFKNAKDDLEKYNMLLKRVLTAAVLIPLAVLAITELSPLYFSTAMGLLILVGAWEWGGLIGFTHFYSKIAYIICVLLGLFLSTLFLPERFVFSIAMIVWIWAFFAIKQYQQNGMGAGFQTPILRALVGFVVLISTWVAIVTLRTYPNFGAGWLLLVLLIIWAADIGAYFAGRFFGKKSLCSRVSPKKTWEGFFGGMLLSVFVGAIGGLFLSLSIGHYFCFLILTLITALFSVVGDLAVSLLKRLSGVKDSGNIFPGHGGMLDRLDSIAAGTVVFVLGALMLGL